MATLFNCRDNRPAPRDNSGVLWFDCCVDAGLSALRANFMFYSKYVIIIISDNQAESTEKGK